MSTFFWRSTFDISIQSIRTLIIIIIYIITVKSIHYFSQAFFRHPFLVFFFETSSTDSNGDPRRQILVSSRRIIPWKFLPWMTKTKHLKWSLPAYAANVWPRRWVSPTRISWDEALLPLTSTLMVNWISAKWRNYWGLENPAWRTMRLKPFLRRWISDLETFIKHMTFLGCCFFWKGVCEGMLLSGSLKRKNMFSLNPQNGSKWLENHPACFAVNQVLSFRNLLNLSISMGEKIHWHLY